MYNTMADMIKLRKEIKDRKPTFRRQIYNHRPNLATTGWRKPKGLHSKMRHKSAGHQACVSVGWGSPVDVEGMHPSGLWPIIVNNMAQVATLDAKTQGALIAAGVGTRARLGIVDALVKKNITILNMKEPKSFAATVAAGMKARKDAKAKKTAPKEEKKPSSKPAAKPEPAMSEEDKKETQRREAEKVMIQKER